ncbi:MAG: phage baseplate assembly protein V [Actinomycetota bacterium]|nr:phage baseplate assembly protein V [Actinomycetota bacterium]
MTNDDGASWNRAAHRHWGKYRGFVVDRVDPRRLGRLRVRVPSLLGDAVTGWAWPVTPYPGLFLLPAVDDLVWVEFVEGDLQQPIWSGCGWARPGGTSEVPKEALDGYTDSAVLRTPGGNVVVISDKAGAERITVRSATGCEVVLDAAAKRVTVRADEVVVQQSGGAVQELATKAFVQQTFDKHTHPTGVGPSGPPTPLSTANQQALTRILKAQ